MSLFDLSSKVSIITGGNGGIGYAMAEAVGLAGSSVIIAGRNIDKSKKAVENLQSKKRLLKKRLQKNH